MATYQLIEAKTSTSTSVAFTSIPATYTDLKIVTSCRGASNSGSTSWYTLLLNGVGTNINAIIVQADNGSIVSSAVTDLLGQNNPNTATADAFSSNEHYIFNYTSGQTKLISNEYTYANNSTTAYIAGISGTVWSDTPAAITSVTLTTQTGNFAANSTFYLYGIKNS